VATSRYEKADGLLRSFSIIAIACALGAKSAFTAEPPADFSRRVLLDQDFAQTIRHGVIALIESAVSGAAGRHTHTDDELGSVVEGNVPLEIDVKAPRIFQDPRHVLHSTRHDSHPSQRPQRAR
jgi:hypothetical protein